MNKEKAKNRTFATTIQSENKSDTIRKRPFTNNDTRKIPIFYQSSSLTRYFSITRWNIISSQSCLYLFTSS
jgi:hypothetical protein